MPAPSATAASPATDYWCGICGTSTSAPGFCAGCQRTLDEEAAAKSAAQSRALAGDPIADALRAHLATLSHTELLVAEHRAQVRLANAERGIVHTKRLFDLGTYGQSSYLAAQDELEAARLFCGLVHEAQQINAQTAVDAGGVPSADGADVDREARRPGTAGGGPVDHAAPAPAAAPVTTPGAAAGVTPTSESGE